MSRLSRSLPLFVLVCLPAVLVRLWLATLGHNYDVDSYRIVARIVLDGGFPYAETPRYNYGPPLAWTVAVLDRVSDLVPWQHPEKFHVVVAGLLTLGDMLIALTLRATIGTVAGLWFFWNPVSMLITGYHSQFDNLAVLLGLWAWTMLQRDGSTTSGSLRDALLAGLLLGVSLALKHVLIFFPIWLLLAADVASLRRRVLVTVIGLGIFFAGFVPWLADPASRAGIATHVFGYHSSMGNGAIVSLWDQLLPVRVLEVSSRRAEFGGMKMLWLAAMVAVGWLASRTRPDRLLHLYLVAMAGLSPAVASQYLAIPLAGLAAFWSRWPSWAYVVMATLMLGASAQNIGADVRIAREFIALGGHRIAPHQCQAWLLLLLAGVLLTVHRRSRAAAP